jgi:hypothetical protein
MIAIFSEEMGGLHGLGEAWWTQQGLNL